MVGLELPNLRDPVELNVTLPWALQIFHILTLTAMEPQTTLSLSLIRMWSVVMTAVRWPETCCVYVCFCVHSCVHVIPFDLLYAYSTLTIENLLVVFYNFRFQRLEHFSAKLKLKEISSHHAVSTTSYCLR